LKEQAASSSKKEEAWLINKVVGLAGLRGKCIRQSVGNAKKNVKCLLNPERTVRYIVKNVILSVKTKAVNNSIKRKGGVSIFLKMIKIAASPDF